MNLPGYTKGTRHIGFESAGIYQGDATYVKQHPVAVPTSSLGTFEYARLYYPHFRHDETVSKFIVPIRPEFHQVLFPDYEVGQRQFDLFPPSNTAGNAIKMAYLCHAQIREIRPGDVVLFYRSGDHRAITSIGVVEQYEALSDASVIAGRVSRRTVYSMDEIIKLAHKPTKVMLFRLVRHFINPVTRDWLKRQDAVIGNIQSIRAIGHEEFEKVIAAGG